MFTFVNLKVCFRLWARACRLTPQYAWPLLKSRTGVEIVVKHENHTPIGSFKVRGGIVYFDRLKRERPQVRGKSSPRRAAITAIRWLSPGHGPVLPWLSWSRTAIRPRKTRRCVRWVPS